MSLYLHMKTEGVAPVAGVTANFNVEYRTSLPLFAYDRDFYADLLTKIHMGVERATTRFEIYNGRDELFISYARLLTDDECPNIYIRTPMMAKPILADKENRSGIIRDALRQILESANDAKNGGIPLPNPRASAKEG